jgi:hypothetical protein
MTKMAESRDLPGWPKKKLVTQVRRQLASFGVRPSLSRLWIETWQWASKITNSYVFPRWPLASEIAAQYMVLLLLEMQANHALKLPFRAAEQQPESVRLRLTAGRSFPMLEQKKESNDDPATSPETTTGDAAR